MVVFNYAVISNKNRTSGTDNDFIIDNFNPPYSRFFRIRRAVFMNNLYNVTNNNNKVTVTVGANPPQILGIAEGIYTVDNLLNAINAALTNIGGSGVNIVAKYPTNLPPMTPYPITFTPTGTSVIKMDFTASDSMYQVVGVDPVVYTITAPADFVTPQYPPNLGYPEVLYLCSKALTSYDSQIDVPGTYVTNVVAIIPAISAYGFMNEVEIRSNFSIFPKQNRVLDFQVRDRNNKLVEMNGIELTLEFLLTDTVEGLWGS